MKTEVFLSRVFNLRKEDPNQETVIDNIKISRGEETIFVWCFFSSHRTIGVFDGDEGYSWVKYIYIDDPISLDDNNAIAVAVLLA